MDNLFRKNQAELLKQLGFESRTLLNGITGPIQLMRSISTDPNLLDVLHILELSTIRFEKFSLRSQILADLLVQSNEVKTEEFDLSDLLKHAVLELNDFLNFYSVKVDIENTLPEIIVNASKDLFFQSLLIIFEQFMELLEAGAVIKVQKTTDSTKIEISARDNGFLFNKFNFDTDELPSDIDLALLVECFNRFRIGFNVQAKDNQSSVLIG
jgi:K+-sensing histidine kinase KdpD